MTNNVAANEPSVLDGYIIKSVDLPYTTGETVCSNIADGCMRISNCSCDTEGGGDSGC